MGDVTLTPVGGDPWNGGAQELDPVTAPPLTVSLGATPQPDPAPYGPNDPPSADGLALQRQSAALSQSLASGHSGDDLVGWLGANMPKTSSPAAAYTMAAATMPAVAGARAVDGLVNSAQWAHDVQAGRYGTFLDNPDADRQVVPGAVQAAMTLGAPGLGMAETGALGAAGGKVLAKAAPAADPFAAMMAKLDAQAPAAVPRTMAETGVVDPAAASWRLHHGTTDPDWQVFDPNKAGLRTSGAERGALFMSPREGEAATYAHGDGARVLSLDVTPGNTGVYDAAHLLATRDPRFMAASRAEFTGSPAAYDAALKRSDADVAYHQDLRGRMPADVAAEMPAYPAVSNLLNPQSAAISMARVDGRDTAILRGLGESAGGDQVVALRPGFVRDANTGALVYSGGLPSGPALAGQQQPVQPDEQASMLARLLRGGGS